MSRITSEEYLHNLFRLINLVQEQVELAYMSEDIADRQFLRSNKNILRTRLEIINNILDEIG